jgi:hypothetical protein
VLHISGSRTGELKSLPAEPHAGGSHRYDGFLPGAPKGSFVTMLSPPHCLAPWLRWTRALFDVVGCYSLATRTPRVGFCWGNKAVTLIFINILRHRDNNNFNSILYFNVLTQQQLEPITESAHENNKCTKICLCIIYYLQNNNINNDNRTNYCSYSHWN